MMNKVMFIGRITKDIELKQINENNKYVAAFKIAVDRGYLDSKGEKLVDFIPVVAWEKLAENLSKYTKKGSLICVIGKLHMKSYETKEGSKRYICEVIAQEIQFLDNKKKEAV